LGKTPGRRSIGGTVTATVCGLGLLGVGALTAQAQVSLPQVPNIAPTVPQVQAPSLPQVPVPEPVQRVLPAPGGSSGGSSGGLVSGAGDAVQGVVGGDGSGSGVGDTVGGTVDRVLGGSGSGSGVGDAVGGTVDRVLGGGGLRDGVERVLGGSGSGGVERALGSGSGGGPRGGAAGVLGESGPGAAGGPGAGPGGAFAAGARGRPGSRERAARRPLLVRRRAAHRRAVERRRERIVRRLRGCLDVLPPMQRTTLILRYGVGPLRARSGEEAARLLDVSRRRVRVLERRGLRKLASYGEGAGCADTGVEQSTLLSVYDLLSDASIAGGAGLPAPLQAGVLLASAATAALGEGEGAVAGERESGGDEESMTPEPEEDGQVSSAGPSLGNPFGIADSALDNPLLLVLLAIVVACLVSAGREIRRALH
jgi:sigma-70-like protein